MNDKIKKIDEKLYNSFFYAIISFICFALIGIIMITFGFIELNDIIKEQQNTINILQLERMIIND